MEQRQHLQSDCSAVQGRPGRAASRPVGSVPVRGAQERPAERDGWEGKQGHGELGQGLAEQSSRKARAVVWGLITSTQWILSLWLPSALVGEDQKSLSFFAVRTPQGWRSACWLLSHAESCRPLD